MTASFRRWPVWSVPVLVHPLAWWISEKVSELAELSCDAVVLEKADDPAGYSRILLEFADRVSRAGHRVAFPGLAMASGSGMGRRIDQVFELSSGLSAGTLRKLSRPLVVLALLGMPVLCLAATMGIGTRSVPDAPLLAIPDPVTAAPPMPAQTQPPLLQSSPAKPPKPPRMVAQQSSLPKPAPPLPVPPAPKFEVASIKPCTDSPGGGRSGGRGGAGGGLSPGRLDLSCQPVKNLILTAYVRFPNGRFIGGRAPAIEGGPSWIDSDRYTIDAKAEGAESQATMRGPMLQALLEDRFHLKIHRETREIPVYALTVAKGGLKARPFQEGSCTPIDFKFFEQFPPARLPELPDGQKYCPNLGRRNGANVIVDAQGTTIEQFCKIFLSALDRPVINKTGATGLFNLLLEYAPDETSPAFHPDSVDASDPGGPSIFTALQQQLGLKLEQARGPGEILVIDRVEKPSGN